MTFVMIRTESQSRDAGVKSMRMYSILNFNADVGSVFIGVVGKVEDDGQVHTPFSERYGQGFADGFGADVGVD